MTPPGRQPMRGTRPSRGQPVIALAMILALWVAVRVTIVSMEGGYARAELQSAMTKVPPSREVPVASVLLRSAAASDIRLTSHRGPRAEPFAPSLKAGSKGYGRDLSPRPAGTASSRRGPVLDSGSDDASSEPELLVETAPATWHVPQGTPGTTGSAPSDLPGNSAEAAKPPPAAFAGAAFRESSGPQRPRWSADGWVMLRAGSGTPLLAAAPATYGGSQAGAVLRYALAPRSPLRPQIYTRFSGALGGQQRQNEAALGLMVRPLRSLPVALLGEWRLQDQAGPLRSRPVVLAVTQIAPLRLPLGIEAEAYGQGGWAGGRDATAFFDLAATLQRRVIAPLPGVQLSAGGGVWSGGQRGAARLDAGPRVELRTMFGPPSRRIGVRVGVDWRFRVAGEAEPGSGPALTLAAGF